MYDQSGPLLVALSEAYIEMLAPELIALPSDDLARVRIFTASPAARKWLRDMRQWWRTVGRTTPTPPNGVTGATRAPGAAKISFTAGKGGMPALTAGSYTLVVEAAREGGGREVVKVPFTVSAAGTAKGSGKGSFELGAVSLTVRR